MRNAHYTVTSQEVQAHAAGLLQRHLGLTNFSVKCTAAVLLHVLFTAAARLTSILAACLHLKAAPSGETLRQALLATLPDYAKLQKAVNRALAGDLPKPLRRRKQRLAIDLHLVPYYGQAWQDPKEIYRSKAKAGTNSFHAYASAYLVFHGQRFTVALTPVERGEDMKVVVQRLLTIARQASVRPRLLLLDRGFYSIAVIRYLQAARVPFLLPAVARGRKPAKDQPATGIRAFAQWKRGGWGKHRLVAGAQNATVLIGVHCGNYRGRHHKKGRYAWVYAYWGFQPGSTRWLADTYRQRFGIETSYRQLNEARITTCTRNPAIRFFFIALALLLRNVWVWYHWERLSSPRRGRRLLRLERLRFKALLLGLQHVAEAVLGICDETWTERPAKSTNKRNQRR
jgi:predicted small integral membrane protein